MNEGCCKNLYRKGNSPTSLGRLSMHVQSAPPRLPTGLLDIVSAINQVISKLITDRNFCSGELISNYRYRILVPEELIFITETELWEFKQKISHYRYRLSLEF